MTVVAWDGEWLAADKMTSFGGHHATTTKVRSINGALVAGCGLTALVQEMIAWLAAGADPATFPQAQRDDDKNASVLVVPKSGPILQYEHTPYPLVIENRFWAIGSGRDYAMMAMLLGKSASEAVALTSHLCHDCGNGVTALRREA
jgi:hypothetical protein